MFGYFYHATIRKYVVAFGTLFNNIYISKRDPNGVATRYRVPLAYAEKDNYIRRIEEYPTLSVDENNPGVGYTYFPRMSFQLTNITYDPSRKRNSLAKVFRPSASKNSSSYSYSEIPYDLTFTLSIISRKMDDGLQIIEQILPFFTPDFYVSMDLTEAAKGIDIPIFIDSYNQSLEYEGTMADDAEHKMITWELQFTMKGFLFGPDKSGSIIREAITQFFDMDNEYRLESVKVGISGGTGVSAGNLQYTIQIFGGTATDADIFG